MTQEGEALANKIDPALIETVPEEARRAVFDRIGKYQTANENIFTLLKYGKQIPLRSISPELEGLPAEDRKVFLELVGRFTASLQGMSVRGEDWKKRVAFECAKALSSNPSEALARLIEKVIETTGLYIEAEKNTNTMGNVSGHQHEIVSGLAKEYQRSGDIESTNILLNPFGLQKGARLYKATNTTANEVELREITVDDLDLKGDDSMVMLDNSVIPLARVNSQLARGELMLRDGSNYFGDIQEPARDIKRLSLGNVTVQWKSGFLKVPPETVEVLGDNEKELREKFGNAYLRDIGYLLKVKCRAANGKEFEMSYNQFEVVNK